MDSNSSSDSDNSSLSNFSLDEDPEKLNSDDCFEYNGADFYSSTNDSLCEPNEDLYNQYCMVEETEAKLHQDKVSHQEKKTGKRNIIPQKQPFYDICKNDYLKKEIEALRSVVCLQCGKMFDSVLEKRLHQVDCTLLASTHKNTDLAVFPFVDCSEKLIKTDEQDEDDTQLVLEAFSLCPQARSTDSLGSQIIPENILHVSELNRQKSYTARHKKQVKVEESGLSRKRHRRSPVIEEISHLKQLEMNIPVEDKLKAAKTRRKEFVVESTIESTVIQVKDVNFNSQKEDDWSYSPKISKETMKGKKQVALKYRCTLCELHFVTPSKLNRHLISCKRKKSLTAQKFPENVSDNSMLSNQSVNSSVIKSICYQTQKDITHCSPTKNLCTPTLKKLNQKNPCAGNIQSQTPTNTKDNRNESKSTIIDKVQGSDTTIDSQHEEEPDSPPPKDFVLWGKKKVYLKHQCTICEVSFPTPSKLKKHLTFCRQKSSEFVCDVCGTGFSRSDNLRTHKKKYHSERSPVTKTSDLFCHICNATFKAQSRMTFHMKQYHSHNAVTAESVKVEDNL